MNFGKIGQAVLEIWPFKWVILAVMCYISLRVGDLMVQPTTKLRISKWQINLLTMLTHPQPSLVVINGIKVEKSIYFTRILPISRVEKLMLQLTSKMKVSIRLKTFLSRLISKKRLKVKKIAFFAIFPVIYSFSALSHYFDSPSHLLNGQNATWICSERKAKLPWRQMSCCRFLLGCNTVMVVFIPNLLAIKFIGFKAEIPIYP